LGPSANVPCRQSPHALASEEEENWPASHARHTVALVVLYRPASHARHAVCWKPPAKDPASQASHVLDPVPDAKLPGRHTEHVQACHIQTYVPARQQQR
jgi:hypothetical protein